MGASGMQITLCWDIDGTLLTTGRAGIFAWEEATQRVTGRPVDFADLPTAGLTDAEIGRQILELAGRAPDGEELDRLLAAYAELLPYRLGWRRGQVMPGVTEVLTALTGRPDCRLLLLTGNLRACAFAKLRHYGLAHFFTDGAFAEDGVDRAGVARRACDLAGVVGAAARDASRIYVIGDTPHDISCGRAVGARTIAVATGAYTRAQLEAARAWRVLDRLPPPAEFCALVGLPLPEMAGSGR